MPDRTAVVGSFQLMLDGTRIGLLKSVDGGSAVAGVVTEKADSSLIPKKHLGSISYSPLVVQVGLAIGPALFDWINASWTGKAQRKDGSIITADYNLTAISQRDFFHAFVTETTIPALDGASKDPAYLTVTLAPEYTRDSKPSGKVAGESVKQKLWVSSNFRVTIDGLDCTRVMRVDALTVKQAVVRDDRAGIVPAQLEFPNLKITLSQVGSETWFAWFDGFVIKGNNDESKEKNGSIALLSPDLKDELLRVDLFNLGIFAIGPEKAEANSDRVATVTAQLYCERMELRLPDKASKPPAVSRSRKTVRGSRRIPSRRSRARR
jgi:T4-like virus tail tube protein gp19